jgi:sigma-E factor negative regulatory protein RseC
MNKENSTVRAVVRAVNGDQAIVEVEHGGCGRCHEKGGCGGQHLTQMFCSDPKIYCVDNFTNVSVGDHVTVAIAADSVRRTANLAYGVPLVVTLIGAAVGTQIGGDLSAILGAGVGLVFSGFYVRFRSRDYAGKFNERPYIVPRS